MELTLELYEMDFAVFGYERSIEKRPDLVPPKKDRRSIMKTSKFDRFSRNSLRDATGARVSQRGLFSSVRSSVRMDAKSARSRTLRQSLIEGDTDELLGALVRFRYCSEVDEEHDEDKLE